MAKQPAVLIVVIVICTFLGSSGARSLFLNRDFIIPADQAEQYLASGKFPEKAGISNLGSYIPPGVAWLEIPGVALHRPLFLQLPAAMVLFPLTLLGIYLLGSECAGPWTGLAAAALFGFYRNGMVWAASIWPRAFPVCYVWLALFTVWWVRRRHPRYLFGAVLILLLGMSVHLELILAAASIAIAWMWFRPPIGKWPLPIAVACSLIVWLPYLRFELQRHFVDLRSQLLLQKLPGLDTNVAFPRMIEQFDVRTERFGPIDPTVASHAQTTRNVYTVLNDFIPAAYANFYTSRLLATMLLTLGLTFAACLGLACQCDWTAWAGERGRSIAIVCLSLGVPWLLLAILVPPNFLVRQGGLLSLQCVIACVGASFLLSLRRGRWVAFLVILAWVIGDARMSWRTAASVAKGGWAGPECAEAKICDTIAIDAHDKPVRVGYFIGVNALELIDQVPDDPTQKIGISFDRYLRWKYGIENQVISKKGFSDEDQYRVLQTIWTNETVYRFKEDLTGFTKFREAPGYELWKRADK